MPSTFGVPDARIKLGAAAGVVACLLVGMGGFRAGVLGPGVLVGLQVAAVLVGTVLAATVASTTGRTLVRGVRGEVEGARHRPVALLEVALASTFAVGLLFFGLSMQFPDGGVGVYGAWLAVAGGGLAGTALTVLWRAVL